MNIPIPRAMKSKRSLFLVLLVFQLVRVNAQSIAKKWPVNEFGTSVNFCLAGKQNTFGGKRTGYGFGLYKSFHPEQRAAFVLGAEYNFIQFHQDSVLVNRGYFLNAHFKQHVLRFPVTVRIQFSARRRLFLEPGVYCSFQLSGNVAGEGNYDWPLPDLPNASEMLGSSVSAGMFLGLGTQLPISRGKLITKVDVNLGSGKHFMGEDPKDQMRVYYDFYPRFVCTYQLP